MTEKPEAYGNDIKMFEERGTPVPDKNLPQRTDQQTSFFESIERLAANKDVDVSKIKQFMEMQEHALDRNAKQAFNSAMTKAQSKIELVVTKSKNEQTHSNYAKLEAVLISAKPIYTAAGFSLMFYEGETTKDNHKRVCVDIMHEEGHTEKRYGDFAIQTTGIAGKAMMTQIHGEGSAFSYGRRYLTCMIFNIPTGDDNDGNGAGVIYVDEKQLSSVVDMINAKSIDETLFLKHMNAESTDKILAKDFGRAMNVLKKAKGSK